MYRVIHVTRYDYSEPVSLCYNEVRLRPRDTTWQKTISHALGVTPATDNTSSRSDYYGNTVHRFSINSAHRELVVTSTARLDVQSRDAPVVGESPPWEEAHAGIRDHQSGEQLEAFEFCYESPLVRLGQPFREFAEQSFTPGRPLLEAALDLNHRIFTTFDYDPAATTVSTPVQEVLREKKGVCQDFAHLMLAAVRSLGLSARYVSGYLRPRPGVVGDQASHAWISVFCPKFGWTDFDPTNDVIPTDGHFTLAWGRDYGDVAPVKGVILGGGEHSIDVSVRITSEPAPPSSGLVEPSPRVIDSAPRPA